MSRALLTDLYQITMAYAHWRAGTTEKEAVFHLSFRSAPFGSGYTIACGLSAAVDYLSDFGFSNEDLGYLGSIPGKKGRPLFEPGFLEYLRELRFRCDLDAVPEGTVVFPHEPLLRVQGPIVQAQVIETALLNFINFETLIATKSCRICLAAGGDVVVEFGLRRAQGQDGGLTASRAAYVGGCASTSNLLAGQRYGIPVAGTHAHSWVMSFDSELEAFAAYADALPNDCTFLVDTYNSLSGVRHAVEVGKKLRARGYELSGIRLDSGDLAWLSMEARRILDEAGFPKASIVASNDLDEHIITSLKQQGAKINIWGVGTRLVTGHDQGALGGVYKLSAIRQPGRAWEYKMKASDQSVKATIPGILQVRRFRSGPEYIGDAIYDSAQSLPSKVTIIDPGDETRRKRFPGKADWDDLLVPVFRGGNLVCQPDSILTARNRVQEQLKMLHPGIKRLVNPHRYPAGLEAGLYDRKTRLLLKARAES